jgi:alpha-galactosidase
VHNELFLHLDYYVTESSGHNFEYNWWFRKRPDLVEKYCTHGTGWNPGEYAYILKEYLMTEQTWRNDIKKWLASDKPIGLERESEFAAYIINALKGGETFFFNGNVPNSKLITNHPEGGCAEVPILVDKGGFHSVHVGALPPQCFTLPHTSVMIEEMVVETAALTGNPRLVFQAIAHDPLTAPVLSLADIETMVDEMLTKNRPDLSQFKNFEV